MTLLHSTGGPLTCAIETPGGTSVGFKAGGGSWVSQADNVLGDQILGWVFDAAADTCMVYRDGVPLLSSPSSYASNVGLSGTISIAEPASSTLRFDGLLAAAGLFKRALTTEELSDVHDYLLTLVGRPPKSRFELVEKGLLDAKRRRDSKAFVKQTLATAFAVSAESTNGLLEDWLDSPTATPTARLIEDFLPPPNGVTSSITEDQRRLALIRFAKAATVVRRPAHRARRARLDPGRGRRSRLARPQRFARDPGRAGGGGR
jgi:hypothetical protein